MLVAMKTKDSLRQGAIMSIAKRIGLACSTIYQLWEQAESVHALGKINSPEFISCKKTRRQALYPIEFVQEGVKHVLLRKRCTQ